MERPAFLTKERIRYGLGLVFLMVVVCIWVSSSFLMNYMFQDQSYDKPILITYINTGTFTLYLAGTLVQLCWQRQKKRHLTSDPNGAGYPIPPPPVDSALPRDSLDSNPRPSVDQKRVLLTGKGDDATKNSSAGIDHGVIQETTAEPVDKLTLRETAKLSLSFCLLWFAANVCSNKSLAHTSVSVSTILSSTSGLFTLILGVLFRVERLTVLRVLSAVASLAGVVLVMTGTKGGDQDDQTVSNHILGASLAVAGAFFYGCYTILIKLKIGNEDRIHMPTFLGFVGVFNLIFLWPLFFLFHFTGVEVFELPPSSALWGLILLNALVGTFLSDYLWLLAVLMTSPLVVTLGIALTNPLAMMGDLLLGKLYTTVQFWIGAGLVMAGFFLSNFS
ncbi:hypothetical protein IWQ62_001888 [Dispira parvispora]|uniref:EamA domain-containing protein n=1 Tax=Dispira parvispora TaxID=1520584 RepID=A0A9W8AXZ8_9FUNG|nr:hypothetical protein IWQ62_001888 [Dispira parvispora]